MDQDLSLSFARVVIEMGRAVFLLGFGIIWIFVLLFILVLDRQIFMVLLKRTWPITLLAFPMVFYGYRMIRRHFKRYSISHSKK